MASASLRFQLADVQGSGVDPIRLDVMNAHLCGGNDTSVDVVIARLRKLRIRDHDELVAADFLGLDAVGVDDVSADAFDVKIVCGEELQRAGVGGSGIAVRRPAVELWRVRLCSPAVRGSRRGGAFIGGATAGGERATCSGSDQQCCN